MQVCTMEIIFCFKNMHLQHHCLNECSMKVYHVTFTSCIDSFSLRHLSENKQSQLYCFFNRKVPMARK